MTVPAPDQRFSLKKALPILIILTAAIAGYLFLRDILGFESLRQHREALIAFRDQNYLAAVAGFLVIYVVIVAFSLPGAAVASMTGGFLFGLFPGALYNIIAATFGALLIFLAARHGFGRQLSARLDASSGAVRQMRDGLRNNELSFLFLMRLVPAVPFFVANLVPALVGVGVSRFVFTTFFGIIPGALVITWIGAGLGKVFERGETPDLGLFLEPYILGPILALCVLAALPVIVKYYRKKAV